MNNFLDTKFADCRHCRVAGLLVSHFGRTWRPCLEWHPVPPLATTCWFSVDFPTMNDYSSVISGNNLRICLSAFCLLKNSFLLLYTQFLAFHHSINNSIVHFVHFFNILFTNFTFIITIATVHKISACILCPICNWMNNFTSKKYIRNIYTYTFL